jgi:DNA-binding NarL/FixJ family response regulator
MSIKIVIADDHNLIREGLKALLEKEPDISVIDDAADGQTTFEIVRKAKPDIVIMDISMPGLNGIETTKKIGTKVPGVKVIALSMYSDSKYIFNMLKAGAFGYLVKDCAIEELVTAIRAVAANKIYVSPRIAGTVVKDYLRQGGAKDTNYSLLTAREREVLQLVSEGNSAKEIAHLLKVSSKTIETHRLQIMNKLSMHSIAELTKYAIREGLTAL